MTAKLNALRALVKELTWSEGEPATVAVTPIGLYEIVWRDGVDDFGDMEASFQIYDWEVEGAIWFDGLDAEDQAKSAAETDYRTRIAEAIDLDLIAELVGFIDRINCAYQAEDYRDGSQERMMGDRARELLAALRAAGGGVG